MQPTRLEYSITYSFLVHYNKLKIAINIEEIYSFIADI